jgi:hypothetical protein
MLARRIEPVKAMTVRSDAVSSDARHYGAALRVPWIGRAAERNGIAEILTIPPAQLRHAICDVGHVPSRELVTELGPDGLEL